MKFVPPWWSIDYEFALVQVMACRLSSAKALPEPLFTTLHDAKWRCGDTIG